MILRATISVLTLCLLWGGNTVWAAETPAPASAATPVKHILVTIKPLHSIVSALLDGITQPDLLLDGLNSPHSYNLKPSDAQALHNADIIIWVGPTLESYLAKPIALQQNRATVIRLIDMLNVPDSKRPAYAQDVHFWLNPRIMLELITPLSTMLARQLPGSAEKLKKNTARLTQSLKQLDRSIAQRFRQQRSVSAIVYHDAWQYFLNRYQLTVQGIISTQESQQPGPAHLYRLQQTIKDKKIACLLIEPQYKPRYLKSLLAGSAIQLIPADPLGVAVTPGVAAYMMIMNQIADAFAQCLAK